MRFSVMDGERFSVEIISFLWSVQMLSGWTLINTSNVFFFRQAMRVLAWIEFLLGVKNVYIVDGKVIKIAGI